MKEIRRAVEVSKAAHLHRVTGGAARHSDEAADRKLIDRMVKPEARTGRADGGSTKGRHKGKPSVAVNVIAPPGQNKAVPVPVPVRSAPPIAAAPAPAPAPAGPASTGMRGPTLVKQVPLAQGPIAPLPSKNGGRIKHRARGGAVKQTGGENGVGRIEKAAMQRRHG
jgi:hypothetical protein